MADKGWGKDIAVGAIVTTEGRHGSGQPAIEGTVTAVDGQFVAIDTRVGPRQRTISNVRRKEGHEALPGTFDLRRQLGRAPTVAEWRASRGFDR